MMKPKQREEVKPHNPGMSEKAWNELHVWLARNEQKILKRIAEREAKEKQK